MAGVYVIAEAGVNHNGSLDTALALVDAAASAGADAVKFQSFRAESLVASGTPKAAYQSETTPPDESQLDMVRRLELDEGAHVALIARARDRGIDFLSAPFDLESVSLLARLGLRTFKLPSGAVTDLPLLRAVGRLGVTVILSTGMATLDEVRDALEALRAAGADLGRVTVLHCTTEYPADPADVNLLAMRTMAEELHVAVGYSDHTTGITIPIAAAALGAAVIEKHFTLDGTMPGPDHRASVEPAELAEMVRAIRTVEVALGDGRKQPAAAELENAKVARKSIIAARRILAGEVFSDDNLTTKRPGTAMSPMRWDDVIGRTAPRDFEEDEAIEL